MDPLQKPDSAPFARTQLVLTAIAAIVSTVAAIIGGVVKVRQDYVAVLQNEIQTEQKRLANEQQRIANEQQAIKTNQDQLKLRIDTAKQTQDFTAIAQQYLGQLKFANDKQREAIQIDLLDAIALATVSASGETDRKKLEEMPLSLALATQNVDALGLIGIEKKRRQVWFRLAKNSGDPGVRTTAMAALARSSATNPAKHLWQIFELSGHLTDEETLDEAIKQIDHVVRVMERHTRPEIFREDNDLKPVADRLVALRTTSPTVSATDAESARKSVLRAQRVDRVATFFHPVERSAPSSTDWLFRGNEPTPQPSANPSADIKRVIEALSANEADTRRSAREQLSQQTGTPGGTRVLFDVLLTDPTNYRVRVGVASALYDAKTSVEIADEQHALAVIALIGDDDVLVRKYASEFLMKLTDPGSVRRVHARLRGIITNRDNPPKNPNAVYNAAVILGTWMRVLPDGLSEERALIRSELEEFHKDLATSADWANTTRLLGELLDTARSVRAARG